VHRFLRLTHWLIALNNVALLNAVLYRSSGAFSHWSSYARLPSAFLVLQPKCQWLPTIEPICASGEHLVVCTRFLCAADHEDLVRNASCGYVRSAMRHGRQR